MANQADIKAVITAEDKASGVLRGFSDNVQSVGGKILDVAKLAAEGLAVAGAAATAFGVASVKAFSESQDVQAQLQAAFKSTSDASGLSIEALNNQAKALQNVTKYSDEQVNTSQALLMTFTDIRGAVFEQATPAILDLATAMHEDLQSATVQVGKALNDPILGILALHRVGVQFSDTQKQQIQNFVDTNQKAKAQGIILAELNKEFGGSAVAAGSTFSGSLDRLKNKLNDVQEVIGEAIVKQLQPFIDRAIKFANSIDWNKVITSTIRDIKEFILYIDRMWQAIDRVYQEIEQYLGPKFKALGKQLEDLFPVVRKFADEYVFPLAKVFGTVAGEGLVGAIGLVIDTLKFLIEYAIKPVIEFMDKHKAVVYALAVAFTVLLANMAITAAINAIIIGFNTLTLITIPSLMATFTALGATMAAALPVVAVAVAAAAIVASILTIRDAWDAVNNAERAAQGLDNANTTKQIRDLQAQAATYRDIGAPVPARITNAIAALTGNASFNGRASGGSVRAGQPYMVGEQGSELFIPSRSGEIINANDTKRLTGGSTIININLNAGAYMGSKIDARKYATQVADSLKDIAASKNTSVAAILGMP